MLDLPTFSVCSLLVYIEAPVLLLYNKCNMFHCFSAEPYHVLVPPWACPVGSCWPGINVVKSWWYGMDLLQVYHSSDGRASAPSTISNERRSETDGDSKKRCNSQHPHPGASGQTTRTDKTQNKGRIEQSQVRGTQPKRLAAIAAW